VLAEISMVTMVVRIFPQQIFLVQLFDAGTTNLTHRDINFGLQNLNGAPDAIVTTSSQTEKRCPPYENESRS